MGRLWSEESKYGAWLRVELAVCEAYTRRGRIPSDAMARIRQTARVNVARILAIQERVKHEMIALLTSLEEQLGPDSRFVHIGLTTSDVWDTALALQLRDAADLLIAGQVRLRKALAELALRHKDTLTVGRTHGVHAEPTSFGLKAAVWYTEAGRNLERLRRARASVMVGKLSGAVGNFARRTGARGGGVPGARARGRARLHTDRPAGSPRRVLRDPRRGGGVAREDRARGPGAPAHRDPRGAGAVRRGAEGLERDAPQAEPGAVGADLRPGAPPPDQRVGRAGEDRKSVV